MDACSPRVSGEEVTPLEWDSEFFGVSIARAEIDDDNVGCAVEKATAQGVQCLYLVIPGAHPSSVADAIGRGGRLVDIRMTLELETRVPPPSGVRLADARDLAVLMTLARSLSRSSRFSLDPRFSPKRSPRCTRRGWNGACAKEWWSSRVGGSAVSSVFGRITTFFRLTSSTSIRTRGARGWQPRPWRAPSQAPEALMRELRRKPGTFRHNVSIRSRFQDVLQAIVHLWLADPHQPSETTALGAGAPE